MQIPAIIMAGGKSKRFNFDVIESTYREKLLLPLGEKFLIEHVIDAVLASKNINRVIIAVSPFTPHTKSILEVKKKGIEFIETPGAGYHSDLPFIIKKLKLGITIIIVADIPLIKSEILDDVINKYFEFKKPALSIMADIKLFNQYGITPTITFQSKYSQKKLIPLGINIIDGRLIDLPEIDETIFTIEQTELLYNINTADDYFQLRKHFDEMKKQY